MPAGKFNGNNVYGTNSVALWLVAAVGLGLVAYGGYGWYRATQLTPAQLSGSVELNYQLDVARERRETGGAFEPSEEWAAQQRAEVRAELEALIKKEKDEAQSWLIAGIGALIFSLGRMFMAPMLSRRLQGRTGK